MKYTLLSGKTKFLFFLPFVTGCAKGNSLLNMEHEDTSKTDKMSTLPEIDSYYINDILSDMDLDNKLGRDPIKWETNNICSHKIFTESFNFIKDLRLQNLHDLLLKTPNEDLTNLNGINIILNDIYKVLRELNIETDKTNKAKTINIILQKYRGICLLVFTSEYALKLNANEFFDKIISKQSVESYKDLCNNLIKFGLDFRKQCIKNNEFHYNKFFMKEKNCIADLNDQVSKLNKSLSNHFDTSILLQSKIDSTKDLYQKLRTDIKNTSLLKNNTSEIQSYLTDLVAYIIKLEEKQENFDIVPILNEVKGTTTDEIIEPTKRIKDHRFSSSSNSSSSRSKLKKEKESREKALLHKSILKRSESKDVKTNLHHAISIEKEILTLKNELYEKLEGKKSSLKSIISTLKYPEINTIESTKDGYKITLKDGTIVASHKAHKNSALVSFENELAKAIVNIRHSTKKGDSLSKKSSS